MLKRLVKMFWVTLLSTFLWLTLRNYVQKRPKLNVELNIAPLFWWIFQYICPWVIWMQDAQFRYLHFAFLFWAKKKYKISQNIKEPPWTTNIYQEPPRTTKNHQEPPRTTKKYQESSRTTKSHQEQPRTTKNNQNPPWTINNHQQPTRTTKKHQELSRTLQNHQEPLRTNKDHQ